MDRLPENIYPCLTLAQIEDYEAQRLGREAMLQVEKHLLECPDCNEAFEAWQTFPDTARVIRQMDDEADSLFKVSGAGTSIIRRLYPLAAAAAIAILLISGGIVYYNSLWHVRLYDQYFTSYENFHFLTFRGENETPDRDEDSETKAFYWYDLERYHESIHAFEQVLKADPENTIAWFYAGMALMETSRFEEALRYLEKVRYNDTSLYAEATFYMALCYLRLRDTESAVVLLREIKPEDQPYGNRAQELVRTLSK